MSSKEVKNLLKEAREAIKNKEFQLAIKKCKEALTLDKQNGMTYILLGAAYTESDKLEAVKCLRKAMDISSDYKLLALQGLSNCVSPKELPDVLEELLSLTPEKYADYYFKLNNLVMNEQILDHTKIITIFCAEIKNENERKFLALKYLLNIFMKNRELAFEKFSDEFLECLEVGIKDKNHVYHVDIYQSYFKVLHQKQRFIELVKAAEEMVEMYPSSVIPLEWICKMYIENENNQSFQINECLKSNFGIYVERLLEINPNSVLGLSASALIKFSIGDMASSRDILLKINQLQPNWSTCLKKLAITHQKLRAYLLAELVYRKLKNVDLELAEMLIEQMIEGKVKEGIILCEKMMKNEPKALELIAKGNIYLGSFSEAESFMENNKLLKATAHRIKGEYELAIETLKDIENHDAFLEIGRNLFELQKYEESLVNILKATKLDPNNSECFYWLGKIYMISNDEHRSQKCLEKCLHLNAQNEKAITILSSIYRKNKEWDNNLQILENSVQSVSGVYQKTAFFQLGLHHLAQQSYDNAITAFRNVLKYDKNSVECWEALADSYLARGSFNSALNVFQKSVELNPNNHYAKLQIAKIKYTLQQYQESIADYEELLKIIPDYLPALYGIAESHFGRACYLHENHRSGRARDHCQSTLSYLEQAIKLEPSFLCLWRTLGNILEFVATLPEIYNYLILPAAIVCENSSQRLNGDALMDLAQKCYCRCLKINKQDEFVWFDYVANYYKRSLRMKSDNDNKMKFLKFAYNGAKHLVKLAPSKWQNWNLLGIICTTNEINDSALGQHCFIKAINLDKKTFTSWSNLGVFYLKHGEIKLANKAFSRAQQSDTSFLNAWIGQALIAELIGDKDEAMDLFRHCTQLGFHHESSIGYPNYVCSILNEPNYASIPKYKYAIDAMNAIPLALDNIQWHCMYEQDLTFEALSYVGYLSNCQKLFKQACIAYEKALKLARSDVQRDKCLTDLGFCYLRANENEKASKAFSDIKEASFLSTVGLALAYYKDANYQDCYETYQKAIEWLATNDEEKSTVLVAMASMIYAFQGVDDAKMVLFQCIQLKPISVEGLLSLCAISLLKKDKQLSELVIKELKNYEYDENYGHHVSFMVSQYYIKYSTKAEAIVYISSRIHEFPDRAPLRKLLAVVLLETYKDNKVLMRVASKMAQSALSIRIKNRNVLLSEEAAELLALSSMTIECFDAQSAKIFAQKAVHTCPHYWKILKIL
ncbi:hypothetical protein PVAND_007171 [Polypedilum vanderplanki]|uniref:Tetratricopeptide repeat protein 37 n=1 Tax=Polypedilum vanderplanki TaxID=319348 RepID=A0A9J6C668_POLVA|nr:hypothetical protein PVAND_007171 [Polypedilum vanderplanki]